MIIACNWHPRTLSLPHWLRSNTILHLHISHIFLDCFFLWILLDFFVWRYSSFTSLVSWASKHCIRAVFMLIQAWYNTSFIIFTSINPTDRCVAISTPPWSFDVIFFCVSLADVATLLNCIILWSISWKNSILFIFVCDPYQIKVNINQDLLIFPFLWKK